LSALAGRRTQRASTETGRAWDIWEAGCMESPDDVG
jgi:hypothetical protein